MNKLLTLIIAFVFLSAPETLAYASPPSSQTGTQATIQSRIQTNTQTNTQASAELLFENKGPTPADINTWVIVGAILITGTGLVFMFQGGALSVLGFFMALPALFLGAVFLIGAIYFLWPKSKNEKESYTGEGLRMAQLDRARL